MFIFNLCVTLNRVIFVVPLHPCGDIIGSNNTKLLLYLQQHALFRGNSSLLAELRRRVRGVEWEKYIGFYSLKQHATMNDVVVSEQIYVHSNVTSLPIYRCALMRLGYDSGRSTGVNGIFRLDISRIFRG